MALTQKQIENRRNYVGCSDLPVILGVSPFKTAYQLWEEKLGLTPPFAGNDSTHWGSTMEPVLREEFKKRKHFVVSADDTDYKIPDCKPLQGHVDGVIRFPNTFWIWEGKTASRADGWGPDGSNIVPPYVEAQVQGLLLVTGAGKCIVSVLIGGNDFRCYEILPDELRHQQIISAVLKFWNMVKSKTPPAATSTDDLTALWPRVKVDDCVEAPDNLAYDIRRLGALKEQLKSLDAEIENIESTAKLAIKDFAGIKHGGEILATWSSYEVERLDTKALKADYPEIVSALTKKFPQRRFTLKSKPQGETQ